jgi:hypothetical protein
MPKCGCATSRTVLVQGEDADGIVRVEGEGTTTSPYRVFLEYKGQRGCAAIQLCISEHLGPNLQYVDGKIHVKISADPDNAGLEFGTDRGLYVEGDPPGPADCPGRTVTDICQAGGQLSVGAARMGFLANPGNSPLGLEACISNNIDIIHVIVAASQDGIACLPETVEGILMPARVSIGDAALLRNTNANDFMHLRNNAGHVTDPEMRWPHGNTPPTGSDIKGGWWGWRTHNFQSWTLDELVERADGRVVIIADCSNPNDSAYESATVDAITEVITRRCAQSWVMVGVAAVANATKAIQAGATPIMMQNDDLVRKDTAAPTRWTIPALTAANIKWVALDKQYADIVFADHSNAGISILGWRVDRHHERTRMENLKKGAQGGVAPVPRLCGYLSHDPVYTRGPEPRDYRMTADPFRDKTIAPGVLSFSTSMGTFDDMTSTAARGWCYRADPGLFLLPGWGSLQTGPNNPFWPQEGRGRPSVLMGWACPLRSPTAYTINYELKFSNLTGFASNKAGLLFAQDDDHDPYSWPSWMPHREQLPVAYRCYMRTNGAMGLAMFDSRGQFAYLRDSYKGGDPARTEIATGTLQANTWYRFRVQVTPTLITFTGRIGTPQQKSVSTPNTELRGPYFFVEKEELSSRFDDQLDVIFQAGFRNIEVL